MKKTSTLAVAVLLVSCVSSATAEINSYAVASNGTSAVVIESGQSYELLVIKSGREDRRLLQRVASVADVRPNPSVSLSADAGFVAVRFQDEEMTAMVSFYRADTLEEIRMLPATSVAWSAESGFAFLVPSYEFDVGQKNAGLIKFNVETGASQVIATESFFTGEIVVNGDWVVARTVNRSGPYERFCLALLQVSTGAVSESACE